MASLVVDRRWKFAKIPTEVLTSNLSIHARMAFGVLDWHGDNAFPSRQRVAYLMGSSLSSARRGLDELQKNGWLQKRLRKGTSCTYMLTLPGSQGADPRPYLSRPLGSQRANTNEKHWNEKKGTSKPPLTLSRKQPPRKESYVPLNGLTQEVLDGLVARRGG